jgi:hypothetical protein
MYYVVLFSPFTACTLKISIDNIIFPLERVGARKIWQKMLNFANFWLYDTKVRCGRTVAARED